MIDNKEQGVGAQLTTDQLNDIIYRDTEICVCVFVRV